MSSRDAASASRASLVDLCLDFLETAVHALLRVTGAYPADVFSLRRAYGMSVYQSRHPGLNDCIFAALAGARAPLLAGTLECVVLTLLDARSGRVVEAYPIDVDLAAAVSLPATHLDVQTMLASALTRIMMLDSRARAGGELTWTLHLLVHEEDSAEAAGSSSLLASDGEWSRVDPGDPDDLLLALRQRDALPPHVRGTVLKSIQAARMRMQLRLLSVGGQEEGGDFDG